MALSGRLEYNIDLPKKRGRHKEVIEKMDPVASEEVQTNEVKDYLYRLVKQLEDIGRMIITLHLDSYSNTEIAEITGMKTNHINVKLHRLKNKIVEQLKRYTYGSN